MNELLIWILIATAVVGTLLLVWLGRRRQQRARDATANRETQRVALEQAEHIARAQRLAAEREHANAEPMPLAGAVEAIRLAEQARGNADAGREGADITRRIAEGEAARIARDQAQYDAAREAEQAEHDAAAAAEAAAARLAEEAEAARAAAEARAREDAERLARETAEREAAEAAEAAARQAAEAETARLAAEAEAREQQAREQAEREQAEREAALALEAARLAEEARARAEREAAEAAAVQAAAVEAARLAAEAEAEAVRIAAAAAAAVPTRELRADETLVLVADDSKIVRVKLSRLLASQGYRAALAESGEQALEMLAAEQPHLLITDVEMPGIDGFELTRQLRAAAATAELPIVMITSSDDKQEEARAAGVTKLLGKPYSEEALIAAIEQARLAVRVPG